MVLSKFSLRISITSFRNLTYFMLPVGLSGTINQQTKMRPEKPVRMVIHFTSKHKRHIDSQFK